MTGALSLRTSFFASLMAFHLESLLRRARTFAVVASRKTGEMHQNGFTITWVPCTPEVERLLSK